MKFLLSEDAGIFHSDAQLSPSFETLRLPGAATYQISGTFGSIISQHLAVEDFSIGQHHFLIESPTLIQPYVTQATHCLHYMCSGNVSCERAGMRPLIIQQDHYNLYHLPAADRQSAWFEAGSYRSVHINLPYSSIAGLAREYPSLRQLPGADTDMAHPDLRPLSFRMDYNTRQLLKDILTCKETGFSRNLFLKARIMDLLLIYVRDLLREEKDIFGMDERLLKEIRDYLLQNLQRPLTIASLARHFGTNQVSLRRNFKACFQIPIHHFLIRHRMEKAQELLREQLSIHQVAPMVGYADASSFSRAFSTYFGESPSSYRSNPTPSTVEE